MRVSEVHDEVLIKVSEVLGEILLRFLRYWIRFPRKCLRYSMVLLSKFLR
jgi:hypothetical protein